MDEQMVGWMEGRNGGREDGRMEGWIEGWLSGWMEGREGGRRRMNGMRERWAGPPSATTHSKVTLLFYFSSDLSNNSIGVLTNYTFSNMSHLSTL